MNRSEFKAWLTDQLAELEPQIGERPSPNWAAVVAEAKGYCYALGLHDFALSLPDNEKVKTPLTAANQLRRCLAALDDPQPATDGAAMSVAQAAQLLGVSTESVYRLCRRNLLPHTRIGRRITITRQQLMEYQPEETRRPAAYRHL